jgi:hypothetical protein
MNDDINNIQADKLTTYYAFVNKIFPRKIDIPDICSISVEPVCGSMALPVTITLWAAT